MADQPIDKPADGKSWWTTIPGLLTAFAALLTAATGFYVSVIRSTVSSDLKPDQCKTLPVDDRPISCLEEKK